MKIVLPQVRLDLPTEGRPAKERRRRVGIGSSAGARFKQRNAVLEPLLARFGALAGHSFCNPSPFLHTVAKPGMGGNQTNGEDELGLESRSQVCARLKNLVLMLRVHVPFSSSHGMAVPGVQITKREVTHTQTHMHAPQLWSQTLRVLSGGRQLP